MEYLDELGRHVIRNEIFSSRGYANLFPLDCQIVNNQLESEVTYAFVPLFFTYFGKSAINVAYPTHRPENGAPNPQTSSVFDFSVLLLTRPLTLTAINVINTPIGNLNAEVFQNFRLLL